ncbi:phosphoenolpyruvate carboxykinase [Methylocapsa polymorpha]|uniref:Phosphoenolpyruvate carboxykinase (ATP) n=1 Tax=Methylocapsa polymorpha TaxID=3080828 RepID=A0ABZ0HMQ7_9HYPH|nr:phosphoenolpyruvate carboxykinase [Methylocapsa sp. RX1]
MLKAGPVNPKFQAESFGLEDLRSVSYNLEAPRLYEEAIRRGEARIARGGALVAETGAHTGRSPKDKFIVRDALTDRSIWWDNCQPMAPEHFDRLRADMVAHAKGMDLFAQDLYGGAEPAHQLKVRIYTEYAWHSLFIRNLLIRPATAELMSFVADLTILDLPSFRANPARHGCRSETVIAVDFSRRIALIGGTSYAGEIKKAVFGYLNFVLPAKSVMPMHCSANAGPGGDTALFFGLSGTGKTTLSADASRSLIGDDEHGWSAEGVFNFEGGCYAKAIKLSREAEPEIFATSERFGAIMENVVVDPLTGTPDFDDDSKTENTRIAYPLDFIANASATGRAGHPKNIVMLTCDAFGVLPPIAKLDPAQAMYHFLSGYTAKVGGTEKGVREPQATFSTCFGSPFMPRHPSEYGNLLRDLIARHRVDCWLVNTGWTGGKYGVGSRMPIQVTRELLRAALDGSLARTSFRIDPAFGLLAPRSAPGIAPELLDPARTWASKEDFAETTRRLIGMFRENFVKFEPYVDRKVVQAQPGLIAAA